MIIELSGYSKSNPNDLRWTYTFQSDETSKEIIESGAILGLTDIEYKFEDNLGSYDVDSSALRKLLKKEMLKDLGTKLFDFDVQAEFANDKFRYLFKINALLVFVY